MAKNLSHWSKGESDVLGIIIIATLVLIAIISPKSTSKSANTKTNKSNSFSSIFDPANYAPTTVSSQGSGSGSTGGATSNNTNQGTSAYSSKITLSTGDAPYAEESSQEYITLSNYSSSPVDITG